MAPANGNPPAGGDPADLDARWAAIQGPIAEHDSQFAAQHPNWREKHSTAPDLPLIAAIVGAQQARTELAEEAADIERTIERVQQAVADVALLEQSPDALAWPYALAEADTCQEPGCAHTAEWFVRQQRGTTPRPTYRRFCIRDAARRIRLRRRHISTTRRDQTR